MKRKGQGIRRRSSKGRGEKNIVKSFKTLFVNIFVYFLSILILYWVISFGLTFVTLMFMDTINAGFIYTISFFLSIFLVYIYYSGIWG